MSAGGAADDFDVQTRPVPADPGLVAAAREQPGGWVYDIDWDYPEDQPVPPEAIQGGWEVDRQGLLTGRYAVNRRYRPITRPRRKLKDYMHAAASSNPDQWIVEMDERAEELFPNIPDHLQRGWWYVDKEGRISDLFRENSAYRP